MKQKALRARDAQSFFNAILHNYDHGERKNDRRKKI